jgi:hypothetical protein
LSEPSSLEPSASASEPDDVSSPPSLESDFSPSLFFSAESSFLGSSFFFFFSPENTIARRSMISFSPSKVIVVVCPTF